MEPVENQGAHEGYSAPGAEIKSASSLPPAPPLTQHDGGYWNMDFSHGHTDPKFSSRAGGDLENAITQRGSSEDVGQDCGECSKATATHLELFSDLVVVVAIHIVAAPLEDDEWNRNGWGTELWYFIHAFQLWLCWHTNMMSFHVSHLMEDTENAAHYLVTFAWMFGVLMLARHQAEYNNNVALAVFMGVRLLEVATLYYRACCRPPPQDFDAGRLAIIWTFPTSVFKVVLIGEILPLTLAIFVTPLDEEPYAPLAALSIAFNITHRTYFAIMADGGMKKLSIRRQAADLAAQERANLNPNDSDAVAGSHVAAPAPPLPLPRSQLFNDLLLKERYELINLIFLGEIAFACTAGPTNKWFTVLVDSCAMVAAFGCYLLSFAARPAHSHSFWRRSGLHIATGQHLYACLFLVTPGIAAGFILIGETLEGDEQDIDRLRLRWLEEDAEEANHYYGDVMCQPGCAWLLSIATSLYLFFTGLIHFLTLESTEVHYNLSNVRRLAFRVFFAALTTVVMYLPEGLSCVWEVPVVTLLCPLLLVVASLVEIWGIQDRNANSRSVQFCYFSSFSCGWFS